MTTSRRRGHLSSYFTGVAAKRLSAVETSPQASHQHEFNGVNTLMSMLGTEKREIDTRLVWLTDEEDGCAFADSHVTWYDSREAHPTRSEYRLYFPATAVTDRAGEGDLLVVARRPDDSLLIMVAQQGTTIESQITWLFGLPQTTLFHVKEITGSSDASISLVVSMILDYIGVVTDEPDDDADAAVERFGGAFPSTAVFSEVAREAGDFNAEDDPDGALLGWMEREERLFKALERQIVGKRLLSNFDSVDDFVSYSLSVQNRRKSRAGRAFENHVDAILHLDRIAHSSNPTTENFSRPDFLFSGISQYTSGRLPSERLTMLGLKSSCKERWRQVLAEASRVQEKHLLTLEPGISEQQTDEMKSHQLQLVVPAPFQNTYSEKQREWLMSVKDFMSLVVARQGSEDFIAPCR